MMHAWVSLHGVPLGEEREEVMHYQACLRFAARALRRTRNVFTLRAASAHGDSKLKVSTSGSSEWQRIDTPPGRVLFVYRPCCWAADATCGDRVWRDSPQKLLASFR